MAKRSTVKKRPRNIYATDQHWNEIEAAQEAADYTTLSEYMVDSARSEQLIILADVAHQLGRLGLICNEVLTAGSGDDANRLGGQDAQVAVDRIIETCDAVITILRRV